MSGPGFKLNVWLSILTMLCIALLIGEQRLLKKIDGIEYNLSGRLNRLVQRSDNIEEYRSLRVVSPQKRDILYPAIKTYRPGIDTLEVFQERCRNDIKRWINLDEGLIGRDVHKNVLETERLDSLGIIREEIEISFQENKSWSLRGFLLSPINATEKLPGVLCLNGHGSTSRAAAGIESDYTNGFGLALARAGCKVITFDWCFEQESKLFDENDKRYSGHDSLPAFLEVSGKTGLALYMENAYCAFRVLKDDPQIDNSRLGVTGISRGGELTTYFAMIFAPEVAAYYASGAGLPFVYRRFAGDFSRCVCTNTPIIFDNYEFSDLMITAAPVKCALQLGIKDVLWGYWDNIELILETVRPVYESLDAADRFRLDIHPGPHVYEVSQGVEFFEKFLSR